MRILFVAPRFHTNQYQMIKTLQENDHEVSFHVAYVGPTEDHTLLKPITFKQSKVSKFIENTFRKGAIKKPYFFPNIASYWEHFRALNPEIIIIRDPFKYYFSLLAAFFALFTNTKIIFYSQEELYRYRSRIKILKQTSAMAFFKSAWMTPIQGAQSRSNIKLKHMYFVPLPIPLTSSFQTESTRQGRIPKILMIGKYHQERKKHFLLIEAINYLKEKYQFAVTIVGECVTLEQQKRFEKITETVQNLRLTEIIKLVKNIPFNQMEELYSSHSIFVLPAINEQYGVSTTEALAYGLPVICTDTCGARFNIRNGENGLIVKSDSLEELTNALETLISDREKTEYMSEKSLEYVQQNLSGEAFYKSFSKMITDRFRVEASDKVLK